MGGLGVHWVLHSRLPLLCSCSRLWVRALATQTCPCPLTLRRGTAKKRTRGTKPVQLALHLSALVPFPLSVLHCRPLCLYGVDVIRSGLFDAGGSCSISGSVHTPSALHAAAACVSACGFSGLTVSASASASASVSAPNASR